MLFFWMTFSNPFFTRFAPHSIMCHITTWFGYYLKLNYVLRTRSLKPTNSPLKPSPAVFNLSGMSPTAPAIMLAKSPKPAMLYVEYSPIWNYINVYFVPRISIMDVISIWLASIFWGPKLDGSYIFVGLILLWLAFQFGLRFMDGSHQISWV